MAVCANNSKAIKQLISMGVIPPECTRFEIISEVAKPVIMRYEVFMSESDLQQVADVFASEESAEEMEAVVKRLVMKSWGSGRVLMKEYQ